MPPLCAHSVSLLHLLRILPPQDRVDDFSCNCDAGYEGDTCQTNHDDCSPTPCENGGNCTVSVHRSSSTAVDLLPLLAHLEEKCCVLEVSPAVN